MKKMLIAAALVIAALSAGRLAAQELKGAKLLVKEMNYNAGNIVQGTQVNHVFEISNSGNETLIIERVQPS